MYTLADIGLIDGPRDPALLQLAQIAARLCNADGSYVGFIDEEGHRSYTANHVGLTSDPQETFEFPLSTSFCARVRDS